MTGNLMGCDVVCVGSVRSFWIESFVLRVRFGRVQYDVEKISRGMVRFPYYHNVLTNTTQWEKPDEPFEAIPMATDIERRTAHTRTSNVVPPSHPQHVR